MNGGDTNLGGPQVTPSSPTPPTPGPQPAASASSSSEASSPVLDIPHDSSRPHSSTMPPAPALSHTPIDSVIPSIDISLDGDSGTGQDAPTTPTASAPSQPTDNSSDASTSTDATVVSNTASDSAPSSATSSSPITPANSMAANVAPQVSPEAPGNFAPEGYPTPVPTAMPAGYGMPGMSMGMPPANPMAAYPASAPAVTPVGYTTSNIPSNDILLGASQATVSAPRKPKGKIIALIIGIIAAIMAIAAIIFLINSSTNNQSKDQNLQNLFNSYANLFIYGNIDNELNWEELDKTESATFFASQVKSPDIEYFSNLKILYDNFKNALDNVENEDNSDVLLLEKYYNLLNLNVIHYTEGPLTRSEIFNVYTESGENGAKEYIEEKAKLYEDIGDLYDLNYHDLLLDWGNENLSIIILYERVGCLSTEDIEYDCVFQNYDETTQMISRRISELSNYMATILSHSQNDLYRYMFLIHNNIINKSNSTIGDNNEK